MSDLYRIVPPYFKHMDARGSISGLLNTGTWREVNLITSDAGVTRGRHFHKMTEECFVVLSGVVRVLFRRPEGVGNWREEERLFVAGDVFIVHCMVEHTFTIMESAKWINLLSAPMDRESPDFHRYGD